MQNQINSDFLQKIIEAKRMEMEAVLMLLPDKMKGHIEVIGQEVGTMVKEFILEAYAGQREDTAKTGHTTANSKVRKVDIG